MPFCSTVVEESVRLSGWLSGCVLAFGSPSAIYVATPFIQQNESLARHHLQQCFLLTLVQFTERTIRNKNTADFCTTPNSDKAFGTGQCARSIHTLILPRYGRLLPSEIKYTPNSPQCARSIHKYPWDPTILRKNRDFSRDPQGYDSLLNAMIPEPPPPSSPVLFPPTCV